MTSVFLWAGRFVLLGLLYFFLFHLYRALLKSVGSQTSAVQDSWTPGAWVRLISVAADAEVWVEEAAATGRRLEQGESVTVHDRLELGRAPGNGVRVVDPFVSTHHCVIERRGRTYILQDLSTTNGTVVDGTPVLGHTPLRSGAVIQVGATRFRFETR